jgi:type I restriction enzyme R subunit
LDKKQLSESDITTKFVRPALEKAGWELFRQIREEWTFTDGRIIAKGSSYARGQKKRADIVLFYKSNQVALIEVKDNKKGVGDGMQQAKN